MSQIERVNAAQDHIEKWCAEKAPDIEIGAGATDTDVAAVETHIGFVLPEELKAFLITHNEVENWTRRELLSTQIIQYLWNIQAELLDKGTFDDCLGEENDCIKLC